jgi:hypothetical protein
MECYDQDVRREKDVVAYEGASASVDAPRTIQLAHGSPKTAYDALKVIGGGVHFC